MSEHAIIYKFPLTTSTFDTPVMVKPKVLHVGIDPIGSPSVWVEHLADGSSTPDDVYALRFRVHPTGSYFYVDEHQYVGTFNDNGFVGHVYCEKLR